LSLQRRVDAVVLLGELRWQLRSYRVVSGLALWWRVRQWLWLASGRLFGRESTAALNGEWTALRKRVDSGSGCEWTTLWKRVGSGSNFKWTTLRKRVDSGSEVVSSSAERRDRNWLFEREACLNTH
jgi:hypothetical protein